MNITDAIKSGKPFKRKGWSETWYITNGYDIVRLDSKNTTLRPVICDMLADDWELKQEPRKVTLYQYLYDQSGYVKLSIETSMKFDVFCTYHLGVSSEVELLKTFSREIEF